MVISDKVVYNLGKTIFTNPKEIPDALKVEKKQYASISESYSDFDKKTTAIKKIYNKYLENIEKKMENIFLSVN